MEDRDILDYFIIKEDLIPNGTHLLPFSFYLIDRNSKKTDILSFPNIPFNKGDLVNKIKNHEMAIRKEEKNIFFNFFKINQWDYLNNIENIENISKEEIALIPIYKIKTELLYSLETNNFLNLIHKIKEEIVETFTNEISPSVSFCKLITERTLTNDTNLNRVVALSYSFSKIAKKTNIEELSDLILASFFHHLGLTQLSREILLQPIIELNRKELKEYKKHPYLAVHLLKKSEIPLTETTLEIITDHHERYNGNGYPQGKKGDKINLLSSILGLSSHLIDFSNGSVNGKKSNLKHIIEMIRSKNSSHGLETEFGPIIKEIIRDL